MNRYVIKVWNYLERFNGLLAILYFIVSFQVSLIAGSYFSTGYVALSTAIVSALALIICPFFIRMLSCREISCRGDRNTRIIRPAFIRALLFAAPLCVLLFYYFAYWPGAFSPDSINQYEQALSGNYIDWHPVFHTLLFFTVPLKLTGGWIGSIILFQILALSAALRYSLNVILTHAGQRWAILSAAFILCNPQLAIVMYPWKDIAFSIGAVLLSTYSLQIVMTKGEWIKKSLNTALFIFAAAFTTLVRHNALLFTLPLVIALFLFTTKERGIVILLCTAAVIAAIKIPLHSVIGVDKAGSRTSEMLGLPMNVIGAIAVYDPGSLDKDTEEFVLKVSPREVWEKKYTYGSFNAVKFDERTNMGIVDEYGVARVISMAIRCFRSAPVISIKSVINLTESSFSFLGSSDTFRYPGIAQNDYGLTSASRGWLSSICDYYRLFVSNSFSYPFLHLGFLHLILVIALLAKCNLKSLQGWKIILITVPAFVYNWGTSLLLTDVQDAFRFFYYSYLIIPLLLIIVFKKPKSSMVSDHME